LSRKWCHAARSNPKSRPVCCASVWRGSSDVEAVAVSRWRGFSRRNDLAAEIEHVHLESPSRDRAPSLLSSPQSFVLEADAVRRAPPASLTEPCYRSDAARRRLWFSE
jgi:hypothetical protein